VSRDRPATAVPPLIGQRPRRALRPPVFGWSAVETRVALTYAAVWVIALAAWQAGRPDLIRAPRLVLAHVWEGMEL